jgi:ankyrin repeat protein
MKKDTEKNYDSVGFLKAVREGNLASTESLLKSGMNINVEDAKKNTALILACEYGHEKLIEFLVEQKADLNKSNIYGNSPISIACQTGNTNLVRLFIAKGACVNNIDFVHPTPLFQACANNHPEIVQILLDNGADQFIYSMDGHIPLTIACEKGHLDVLKVLVNKGANINTFYHGIVGKYGWTLLQNACNNRNKQKSLDLLKEYELNISNIAPNAHYYEWNPLFIAIRNDHLHIVKWLLEKKVDLKIQNIYGEGPLCKALEYGNKFQICDLLRNQIIENLYEIFKLNSDLNLRKMVLNSVDEHRSFVLNLDTIKAFQTINFKNPPKVLKNYELVEFFKSHEFKEKFSLSVISTLNDQKQIIEKRKLRLLEFCIKLRKEENKEQLLEGPQYDEYSYKQLIDLVSEDFSLLKEDLNESEKDKKSFTIFKYIQVFLKEISQTIQVAYDLYNEICEKCSSISSS